MYEKISTELFSNLIDKINQIPNYSTPYKENPFQKEPQKISQLLHLYNMDSIHKEIFSKIFSNINENNLRQNLIKIMLNIGTKYNSFSVANNNSTLISEANNELLSLFSSTWEYFRQKSEYLKNLSTSENQAINREFIEYEVCFKETVCFTCGLINIIIFMFKKQFSILDYFNKNINLNLNNNNNNKINSNSNKEYIQMEINILFIIHKNRVWLEPLITLLEQIFKFILSNNFYKFINTKLEKYKKKEKEGEMTKGDIIKIINSYINFIIEDNNVLRTIFTVVRKYNSSNNINMILGPIIPINDINMLIQRFFNIYIAFLMNKTSLNCWQNEEQIYCLGINIIKCLLNCKYKDKNYGVDFIGYFYGAQNFIEEAFDEVNIKIINGINDLTSYIKAGCLFVQMPNLNVLQNLENVLKDYIMYSMITCYNKDSLCDCYMNCEKQKQIYLCYGLVRAYLILCKNINNPFKENKDNDINIEKKRQIIVSNIFENLLDELKKYQIILPVKMFLYKNYILQSVFVILHMVVKLFYKEILEINNNKFIFYNNISFIKDLSETINCHFFMLGKDILYYLKFPIINNKENNNENYSFTGVLPYLRIIDEANPINYHTIMQEKLLNPSFRVSHSNTIKYFSNLNNNFLFNNCLNIENSNILGNSSIFNFSKNSENNITSALFNNHTENNNKGSNSNSDNIFNKNGYTIMPTNTFQSNIFKTDIKRKKGPQLSEYFYRYDITNIYDNYKKEQLLSLSKIGFNYKFEDNHHYLYIDPDENNNFNFNQVIYFGKKEVTLGSLNNSNLYNTLKNEPFTSQIIEQLYVNLLDGFDESNKGKNSEISLKYYDISFNMDYFEFVEKCKEFIL